MAAALALHVKITRSELNTVKYHRPADTRSERLGNTKTTPCQPQGAP